MKIREVKITNFRQYYGSNSLELGTSPEKNIVLIGGMNGYGKTNLLLALVWCLYGEKISQADSLFRKQIHKEGNYSKFLKNCLNWSANKENIKDFSVEIEFTDLDLPQAFRSEFGEDANCVVSRKVNTHTIDETLSVKISNSETNLLRNEEDMINFINDYLIPLDAAKFVFFDAEKIAEMAELSTREEGELMNDALGNILGLDIYESLVEDLIFYSDSLKKEGTSGNIKDQIIDAEKTIELKELEIESEEGNIAELEDEITELQNDINQYNKFISQHYEGDDPTQLLTELHEKADSFRKDLKEAENNFTELSELIPFALTGDIFVELNQHLQKQDLLESYKSNIDQLNAEADQFVELLFNKPEFPPQDDLPFSAKSFYAEKAKKIIQEMLSSESPGEIDELTFEHDLTNSDKELIDDSFKLLQGEINRSFEITVRNYIELKNSLEETNRKIRQIESESESDDVIKYRERKEGAEKRLKKCEEEKSISQFKIKQIRSQVESLKQTRKALLQKSAVSKKIEKELGLVQRKIDVLNRFIIEEKNKKSENLSSKILIELRKLLHKLNSNDSDFITNVSVKPLPDNEGLNITLYDSNNQPLKKDSLSEGEKQIYISALIKGILAEAIQDFPIVIDTPLGRLDEEHIKNMLKLYYPNLANQVILMSTSSEIPPFRKKIIENNIDKLYLIINSNNKSSFQKGYFTSYEN